MLELIVGLLVVGGVYAFIKVIDHLEKRPISLKKYLAWALRAVAKWVDEQK